MIGIIYKFTILTNNRFYIGQHVGIDDFESYWGSGALWLKYLACLKQNHPLDWKNLVKREILWSGRCNQFILDKLEEIQIRREKSLVSDGRGGCNILKGTANGFGCINPSQINYCKEKQRKSLKEWWNKHPEEKEKVSKRRKGAKTSLSTKMKISLALKGKFVGENNPMYGHRASEETRKKMSESQKKRGKRKPHSEKTKKLISETRKKYVGEKHPLYGCHYMWINNSIVNKRWKGTSVPEGWKRGRTK